eukprot:5961269-Alexandrium_andersonii.AAC.1
MLERVVRDGAGLGLGAEDEYDRKARWRRHFILVDVYDTRLWRFSAALSGAFVGASGNGRGGSVAHCGSWG